MRIGDGIHGRVIVDASNRAAEDLLAGRGWAQLLQRRAVRAWRQPDRV